MPNDYSIENKCVICDADTSGNYLCGDCIMTEQECIQCGTLITANEWVEDRLCHDCQVADNKADKDYEAYYDK